MKRKLAKYKKIFVFISTGIFVFYVIYFAPGSIFSLILFYFLLLICLLSLLSLFFDIKRNLVTTGTAILILILRQIELLNLLNLLIIATINLLLVVYFRKNKRN